MESAIEKCKAAEEVVRFPVFGTTKVSGCPLCSWLLQVGDLQELYCKACEEGDVIRQDWLQPEAYENGSSLMAYALRKPKVHALHCRDP